METLPYICKKDIMKYKHTKEDYINAVKKSNSIAGVCRELGILPIGGNYATVKRKIIKYNLDTSHFTGQLWKGKSFVEETALVKLDDILKENTNYKTHTLKERLFNQNLKERKCEICGLGEEWYGKPITLELHHINGDHYDNRLENLQILCPNCHSQTNNFRNRNNTDKNIPKHFNPRKPIISTCECCGKEFKADRHSRRFCSRECYNKFLVKGLIKQNREYEPLVSKEEIENKIPLCTTMSKLAKLLEIDRHTLRDYLHKYSIYESTKKLYNSLK